MVLPGFGCGFQWPPDFYIVEASAQTLGSTGTTVTISNLNFKTSGNFVIAFSHANSQGDVANISSVTINGVTASQSATSDGTGVAGRSTIYTATAVPGGTGSVVITFSSTKTHTVIYGIYAIGDRTLENIENGRQTRTSISSAVSVSQTGVVISTYMNQLNNSTSAFSGGVTQDYRGIVSSTNRPAQVGSLLYPVGGTATVTSTTVSSSDHRWATASYS